MNQNDARNIEKYGNDKFRPARECQKTAEQKRGLQQKPTKSRQQHALTTSSSKLLWKLH